jgi:hypothetical protein
LEVNLLPALAQGCVKALSKLDRQFERLAVLVEGDGLANVVHNDLAGVTAGQVLLELLAEAGVYRAVYVFVQDLQQFLTFHDASLGTEPSCGQRLQG